MKINKKSLDTYLVPENEPSVLEGAKGITVLEVPSLWNDANFGKIRAIVMPIVSDSDILRKATSELLKEGYIMLKVRSCHTYQPDATVEELVKEWESHRSTSWHGDLHYDMPKDVRSSYEAKFIWRRQPKIAQSDISVIVDKIIYNGREDLISEQGQAFMSILSEGSKNPLIKTYLTPAELRYIETLQTGIR